MSKAGDIALICACCCGFPLFIALTCILLAIPLYLLIVGIVEMDSCPADPRIPRWMLATSCFMIIERMIEAMIHAMDRKFLNDHPEPSELDGKKKWEEWEEKRKKSKSMMLFVSVSVARLAIFVATIVGSVFVFSALPIRFNCNGLLYWSGFVYCILALSLSAIGLIVVGGMFCVLAMVAYKPRK